MLNLELFTRAAAHGPRVAIVEDGRALTYRDLLERSNAIADWLSRRMAIDERSPHPRIAYLIGPGFVHVATEWAIWRAGAIGVPLSGAQAPAEWSYAVADSGADLVIVDAERAAAMRQAIGESSVGVVTTRDLAGTVADRIHETTVEPGDKGALILYTSGTTGKPKGVVLTHANIEAQVRCLVAAWEWRPDDRILHVLPLNHVHGIVNVLTCAMWSGASCEMPPKFDVDAAWAALASGRLTLFMAVPTIYARLIAAWEAARPDLRHAMSSGCRALRLMVSGSAALPSRVLDRWREISGHVLLERYGMTEIGMALSNPLHGERRAGCVGTPLPGVRVQIVDEHGVEVPAGVAGELEVRAPGVFREYWRRPDATAAAFRNGWFRTGDVAVCEGGVYRLLGRQSVDIIKSGGYKISALEIEEVLREHPGIAECAVVGLDDLEWGEVIAVVVVPSGGPTIDLEALRDWCRPRLARYKLPARLLAVGELPRNAMGKVSKPAVKELFE